MAPHHTQAALHQFQRPGQRELAGVSRTTGFGPLARVVDLVEADQTLVAHFRHHIAHHTPGRQAHGRDARVQRQQLLADLLELVHAAIAFAHQRHQHVVG